MRSADLSEKRERGLSGVSGAQITVDRCADASDAITHTHTQGLRPLLPKAPEFFRRRGRGKGTAELAENWDRLPPDDDRIGGRCDG